MLVITRGIQRVELSIILSGEQLLLLFSKTPEYPRATLQTSIKIMASWIIIPVLEKYNMAYVATSENLHPKRFMAKLPQIAGDSPGLP